MTLPCDAWLENPDATYHRGIDIAAPAAIVYRWVCQLRVAPYSYDWVDNRGRRSPRRLIAGLDDIEVNQKILIGFDIVEFEPHRHITIRGDSRHVKVFGNMVASYVMMPEGPSACRLLARVRARYPRAPHGWLMRLLLPIGDFLMMRKQFYTFKQLAESSWTNDSNLLLAAPPANGAP